MLTSALRLATLRLSGTARPQVFQEIRPFASAAAGPLPSSTPGVPYGVADFAAASRILYFDRTHYIPLLERKWGPAAVMLRPRGFGKSLFLSMLDYYYNVLHANAYDELFGHLRVSSHRPTDPRDAPGSWLVLRLDFSGVQGNDAATFDSQLHSIINNRLAVFRRTYSEYLQRTFDIDPTNGATSLQKLIYCVGEDGTFRGRLLVLVDEYDSPVNVKWGIGRQLSNLREHRVGPRTDKSAAGDQSVELTPELLALPFQSIFSMLKKGLELGSVGRVYVTGVAPVALYDFATDFNVATDLSTDPDFAELFGFTEAEVRQALERVRPAHATLSVDDAVAQLRREFHGYRFTNKAPLESGVYNSTQVLHYVKNYACTGKAPSAVGLVDLNVHTNSATLQLLSAHPRSLPVLNELLSAADMGTAVSGEFQPSVGVADMLDPLSLSVMPTAYARDRLLSYLYYPGAVTFAPASAAVSDGDVARTDPGFVIPHAAGRRDFVAKLSLFALSELSRPALLAQDMRALVFHHDLRQLLDNLADALVTAPRFLEHSLKDLVHAVLLVASADPATVRALGGRSGPVTSALTVPDVDSKPLPLDLVYAVPTRGLLVHIEFKNVLWEVLPDPDSESWDDLWRFSHHLLDMTEDALLKVAYDDPWYDESKEQERRTLGDDWNDVRSQARQGMQALQRPEAQAAVMRRLGKPSNGASQWQVVSFAVFQAGMFRVLCEKV